LFPSIANVILALSSSTGVGTSVCQEVVGTDVLLVDDGIGSGEGVAAEAFLGHQGVNGM